MLKERVENISRTNEINKFVTRVWYHPLVTVNTLLFRMEARDRLQRFLNENRINQEGVCFIPVGSQLWSVNDESDADFMCFTGTQEIYDWLYPFYRARNKEKDELYDSYCVDVVRLFNFKDDKDMFYRGPNDLGDIEGIGELFLTPDNLVIGDLWWTRALRLKLINAFKFKEMGGIGVDDEFSADFLWNFAIDEKFDGYYKKWGSKPQPYLEYGDTRQERFERLLNEASQLCQSPNMWRTQFTNNLQTIKPPSRRQYTDTLQKTRGSIDALPRYMAMGI